MYNDECNRFAQFLYKPKCSNIQSYVNSTRSKSNKCKNDSIRPSTVLFMPEKADAFDVSVCCVNMHARLP
jgi:hypothetical protein